VKKITNKILNFLIGRYEKSKCSIDEVRRTINIKMNIEKDLPLYFESLKNKELIDEALHDLERKHWVSVLYKDLEAIEITLNTQEDVIKEIYVFLGKKTKRSVSKDCIDFLSSIQTSGFVSDFKEHLLSKLLHKESIAKYFNAENITEIAETFNVLNALLELKEETLYRDFSTAILHDSKRFGEIQGKIVRIIKDFTDLSFEEDDEYLSVFNLIKNPSAIWIKGNVVFEVDEQVIDLIKWGTEFILPSSVIKDLILCSLDVKKVITTENLTTFFSFSSDNSLVIYLGGYHNAARRLLLQKLYEFNSELKYYHFGDIDAGGFYILRHLIEKTGIKFNPYCMDIDTLKIYSSFTKPLSENDKKRLKNLLNSEYAETIQYMLQNNCKLEQEAIAHTTLQN